MRRSFDYWTGGPTEDDARRGLKALVEELGHEPVEVVVKPSGPPHAPGGFEVSFTLELPDPQAPLLARIEEALREVPHEVTVALSSSSGFADLYWEPMSRKEAWINETVRLDGPKRYGVIGFLSGEYRICVCSNDDQPYEPGFVAAERELPKAVVRVLRYIEGGMGAAQP